jgi:hypothetical protein
MKPPVKPAAKYIVVPATAKGQVAIFLKMGV